MRIKCTCHHEYQDNRYGKGVRVATPKKLSQGKPTEVKCTVCGTVTKNFTEK